MHFYVLFLQSPTSLHCCHLGISTLVHQLWYTDFATLGLLHSPSHRGSANVRVSVTNVNDEDPVFIQPVEHVPVSSRHTSRSFQGHGEEYIYQGHAPVQFLKLLPKAIRNYFHGW